VHGNDNTLFILYADEGCVSRTVIGIYLYIYRRAFLTF
jgi:hypothetical protein